MSINSLGVHVVNGTDMVPMPEMLGSAYSSVNPPLPAAWRSYFELPKLLSKTIVVVWYAIGLLANVLALAYFIKSRKYRVPIFTLFTSLAISDMLTCLAACTLAQGVYPAVIFPVAPTQITIIANQVISVAAGASVLDLIFLAALRYYQLCYPLQAKVRVTVSWVMRWCVVMWLVSGVMYMPMVFFRDVSDRSYNNRTVKLFVFTGNVNLKNILESIAAQVIPIIVITTLHMLKLYKMAVNSELTNKGPRSTNSRITALIIVTYAMSIVVRLAHSFSHGVLGIPFQRFHIQLALTAAWLGYSNSIANPFIYFFCSAEMREYFWNTIVRCKAVKS